jgi:NTE family protein
MKTSKQVSLALSSGGARGLAHIGVIEALEAKNYRIQALAGCSMGALIGGIYAKGNLPEFKEWICNLDRIDVFSLMDFTISSRGLIKGDRVFMAIQHLIGDGNIEELPIPFACNAVDLAKGREKVFHKGNLFQAIRASASIPTVFKPFLINGREYVDGGVLNPIPINHLKLVENSLVLASDVNGPIDLLVNKRQIILEEKSSLALPAWAIEYREKFEKYFHKEKKEVKPKGPGFLELMNLSYDLMQDRLCELLIKTYPVDILFGISRRQGGTFEFYKAKEIIDIGRELAEKTLDKFEENQKIVT